MQQTQHTNWHTLIVGLGKTGLSIARYLSANDVSFAVMDTRLEPPSVEVLRRDFPEVECHFGGLSAEVMCSAQRMIVSPGIALATPEIEKADLCWTDATVSGDAPSCPLPSPWD